jgi:hypothetical protein
LFSALKGSAGGSYDHAGADPLQKMLEKHPIVQGMKANP